MITHFDKWFVAEYDGYIIGMVSLVHKDNFYELKRLQVNKEHRRKGVASELLKKCEIYSVYKNINKIKLTTVDIHYKAIEFYKKNGYKIDSTYKNLINMSKTLIKKTKKKFRNK